MEGHNHLPLLTIVRDSKLRKMVTEFQKRVYQIIKKIPKGKVLTYKQVAEKLGNKNLARAVGNALNKNRDPKVPCHRVIRSGGKIGGYNRGAKKKIALLRKEGIKIKNRNIEKVNRKTLQSIHLTIPDDRQ